MEVRRRPGSRQQWVLAILALAGLSAGSVELHPEHALDGPLTGPAEYYSHGCDPGRAPHVETAELASRPSCAACLSRFQRPLIPAAPPRSAAASPPAATALSAGPQAPRPSAAAPVLSRGPPIC